MALAVRHSPRLLSPSEAVLYALLPSAARTLPCRQHAPRLTTHTQRRNNRAARELPPDFNINRLLYQERTSNGLSRKEAELLSDTVLDEAIPFRWVVVKELVPTSAPTTTTSTLFPSSLDEQEGAPSSSAANEDQQPSSAPLERLSEPKLLTAVLSSIDRRTHCVRLLSDSGPQPDTAIVQVVPRAGLLASLQEKVDKRLAQQQRQKLSKPKQIEMNWGISEHDFALKLKKMEEFLVQKGRKVEVLMAHKKRAKKATLEEAERKVESLRQRIEELGLLEGKFEGRVGETASMVIERRGGP
ncbi:uncharacterized protein AB675_1656 [Cyphellophora attinorum]|uniref:Translation initiation factor 3 C-terminal domain-containing protein n=1 Tax=Cyphellophora attinorum TaxID=1664694 RepID=A0A0N0NIP6_9EURO|nr:uncharacterized protein AB675_1656 [Phialophora attinorum]KPI36071.1 hypothetical protein AB675_1656 [Phialophora attinorum]